MCSKGLSNHKVCEMNKYAYVDFICVRSFWRGKGIGKKLLADGVRVASEEDIEVIGLTVNSNNSGARRMYEKANFRMVKEDILAGNLCYECDLRVQ
jgi:ribosomal protein S18 acetylase RimI-like enzyme